MSHSLAVKLLYMPFENARADPPLPEVRSLARAIVVTRKHTKKLLRACDSIETWEDLQDVVAASIGWVGYRETSSDIEASEDAEVS